MKNNNIEETYLRIVRNLQFIAALVTFSMFILSFCLLSGILSGKSWMTKPVKNNTSSKTLSNQNTEPAIPPIPEKNWWKAPDISTLPNTEEGKLIAYGRDLVSNTASYLGPKGSAMQITNGMNCKNCHLDAGTKVLGNNYSGVASTYPKFRPLSGSVETIEKRVNDCIERSLNGKALDSMSREMRALVAYMSWIGKDVPKDSLPAGVGIHALPYLDRPASPEKGQLVYVQKCQTCHQANGEGQLNPNGITYLYPPLWGKNSYNIGAGLFRLSRFAGYVKVNMPLGATYRMPQLTDEEAWDVAAYVNCQKRPDKDLSNDWPNPFGPYEDGFSEQQHKYGPFQPIADARKKQKEQASANK